MFFCHAGFLTSHGHPHKYYKEDKFHRSAIFVQHSFGQYLHSTASYLYRIAKIGHDDTTNFRAKHLICQTANDGPNPLQGFVHWNKPDCRTLTCVRQSRRMYGFQKATSHIWKEYFLWLLYKVYSDPPTPNPPNSLHE